VDVTEAIMTTGSCRYYKPDPIPDDVLMRVLDAARYAPQGGNRQPVRLLVVRDQALRTQLKEWYLQPWNAYMAAAKDGLISIGSGEIPRVLADADHFAQHMDVCPVHVVVCAKLDDIHPTDLELNRPTVVYGASIYPAVQNLILKARAEGLGSSLTTLLCHFEPQMRDLLHIPQDIATAAVVTLGWPVKPFPKKLDRRPLADMVHFDRFGEVAA
jgi:nitroreductase